MGEKINSDNFYIEGFLGGDKGCFLVLVKKYQKNVLNIIYSLIGKDKESEDITQEVFLKVYCKLSSFRGRSCFSTWLYRITVNTTYDFLRKRKKIVIDQEAVEKSQTREQTPKELLFRKEQKKVLEKALAKVPLKFRAALVLKDIEGLSYKEISKVLGCRMGTVESKIYRARQFLKKELAGELKEYD